MLVGSTVYTSMLVGSTVCMSMLVGSTVRPSYSDGTVRGDGGKVIVIITLSYIHCLDLVFLYSNTYQKGLSYIAINLRLCMPGTV